MIDIYDTEALINVYRMLDKKCRAIDRFINNHAYYFGPCTEEFGALDVCNNIIDLMTRKNQLINLKLIMDSAIDRLEDNDKKVIYLKTRYSLSTIDLCDVLEVKERTVFRRVEHAIVSLTSLLNKSKYIDKLEGIIDDEFWISSIRDELKDRRIAYKTAHQVSIL